MIKVKPIFAWYDLWVGFYYDRLFGSLYFLPVPMLGFRIDFSSEGRRNRDMDLAQREEEDGQKAEHE